MAKAPGGPAAASFTNPRKTGWLYKHGGSGLSSHWKKRWFIADDHYLFYYKGPNDKRPVGILCLPEYGSCQRADVKEWKKPFSFVLGRAEGTQENTESGGGNSAAGKDYVLYSETEEDMVTWIKALQEEMKHTEQYSNAGPGTYGTSIKVKVDQKALEEVTKAACDGPKLTHLTAQRPRVRGRRPPKRYATYHEEDKDESPPDTPTSGRKLSTTPLQPISPSPSPTSQRKGHRPVVPLMPKQHSLTSSPPPTRKSPKYAMKPPPPSKPTAEGEEDVVETAAVPKMRPLPPKRPLKSRLSNETPVPAPRPIPAPRKSGGKDVLKSPLRGITDEVEEVHAATEVLDLELVSPNIDTKNEHKNVQDQMQNEKNKIAEQQADYALPDIIKPDLPSDDTEGVTLPLPVEETVNDDIETETKHESRTLDDPLSPIVSSTDEYEQMRPGVTKGNNRSQKSATKSPEYDEPHQRNTTSALTANHNEVAYAIPCHVTKQGETTYDVPVSTAGATGNVTSSTPQIPIVATPNEEDLTTGRGESPSPPCSSSVEDQLKPFRIERDALGYAKVMKQRSNDIDKRPHSVSPALSDDDEQPPPPLWAGMDKELINDNVPSTLNQSREILRLAQVMKQEVEEMRREVQQELDMARRERQNAELLKINAIEILRMAKEKLHPNQPM